MLAFAKRSTDQARRACEFLIKNAPCVDEATYEALVTGIFVLYARPFGGNNAVGCLPKRFGEFKDGRLQNTHQMILLARNHFVAHTDATYRFCDEKGKEKDELLKLELMVSFRAEGMADVRTQVVGPRLAPEMIPIIKTLCDVLLKKLDAEETTLIKSLFENRPLREGRHPINLVDES